MNNQKTLSQKYILIMCVIISFAVFQHASLYAAGIISLNTDKCSYKPGDSVIFYLELSENTASQTLLIKYYHLNNKIGEQEIMVIDGELNISWSWLPPPEDYKGYLVQVDLHESNLLIASANIAVDVSSDWKKFPRYGFVSEFPVLSEDSIKSVITNLNRHHINGIQFYDWHYKHHQPLKGTVDNPADSWKDIANRTNYLSTILSYINEAHSCGMKTMAYNLVYGAFSTAYMDGVKDEWGLYQDRNHAQRWGYDLPDNWAADLYFQNPGNEEWKSYIYKEEKKVFQAIPFDGWHADQVGDPGNVYDFYGDQIFVKNEFEKFLTDAKTNLEVNIVFNAVNQYGQEGTAKAPVDFLYTEVWEPNNTYTDLIRIVNDNTRFSNNNLSTVFAAYVNQGLSDNPNKANTSAVLLADAVMFSAGASHLELGEHLLCHPYFPNKNLTMESELKKALVNYYDFLVAYENLLRDNFEYVNLSLESLSGTKLSNTLKLGSVYYFTKQKGNKQAVHLLNFIGTSTTIWSDPNGTQSGPAVQKNFNMKIPVTGEVKSIWFASPDTLMCLPLQLEYTVSNGYAEVTIPYLKYWDIIVIENEEGTGFNNSNEENMQMDFRLGQNYPNPFNPSTIIPFDSIGGKITLKIYNMLGEEISRNNINASAGSSIVKFNGSNLASGNYIYLLEHAGQIQSKKMNLLK